MLSCANEGLRLKQVVPFIDSDISTKSEYENWTKKASGDGVPNEVGASRTSLVSRSRLVTASGNTEFGRFVSAGRLNVHDTARTVLTLARRYVADSDPRAKLSAKEVASQCIEAKDFDEPWKSLRWKIAR